MVKKIKTYWKYSSIRFYIKNAIWNYNFWFNSRKKFKEVSYIKRTMLGNGLTKVIKKKFEGYEFKGKIFTDNPGMPIEDRNEWEAWKNKGLI